MALPLPDNFFIWNFVIFGLTECDYEGGVYLGTLTFPEEYPMKPPAILMLTPNGRFETNARICMSMSDYHPESWCPTWKVETIIIGLISFMTCEDYSVGTIKSSKNLKK